VVASAPDERAIVVGAGIAGLSAAFRLKQAGFGVRVLEAGDSLGGRMSTVCRDGYRIDPAASFISSACGQMTRLIADAGIGSRVGPTSSLFGIPRGGVIHRMSMDAPLSAARTRLLSRRAKLGLLSVIAEVGRRRRAIDYADLARSAPFDDESLGAYARRRLSPEAYDYFVEPMSAGCFGVLPDEVSKAGFFFMLANFLFAGGCLNSPDGIGFLAEGLASHVVVEREARVRHVEETGGGVEVTWEVAGGAERTEAADVAVLAVPAPLMLPLYPQLPVDQREIISAIEYTRSISVSFGLEQLPPEPSAMMLIPPREHPGVLVVVLEHNKAPGRAPLGKGLVTFDWQDGWSAQNWDLDDDAIACATQSLLARAVPGLVEPGNVDMTHVARWDHALVRTRPGHYRALARLDQLRDPVSPVQLAGDYLALSATGAAMCSGEAAAARIVHGRRSERLRLGRRRPRPLPGAVC
jgi:protoporphyrinogen/coproporphyrinogen III oxidase